MALSDGEGEQTQQLSSLIGRSVISWLFAGCNLKGERQKPKTNGSSRTMEPVVLILQFQPALVGPERYVNKRAAGRDPSRQRSNVYVQIICISAEKPLHRPLKHGQEAPVTSSLRHAVESRSKSFSPARRPSGHMVGL